MKNSHKSVETRKDFALEGVVRVFSNPSLIFFHFSKTQYSSDITQKSYRVETIMGGFILRKLDFRRKREFGLFNIQFVAKYRKIEGVAFEDIKKFSKKKSHSAEKTERGPLTLVRF